MSKSVKSSYSLLQRKLSEVEKTKKPANKPKKNPGSNDSAKKESKAKETKKASPPPPEKKPEDLDPNVPDRSYGDYFCSICDSHMNSDAMWEAHITGKRHMKNVSKGDKDTKYEDLDEESNIMEEIQRVKDPVIGLQYIHEIRRRDGVPPVYNCFLCHASIATIPLVIDHILSLKHRTNFVKENSPESYAVIEGVNLKKGQLEPLLLEECAKLEEKMGRGKVKVKREKPKMIVHPLPYKRKQEKNEEDDRSRREDLRPDVIPVAFVPGPSKWRSTDLSPPVSHPEEFSFRSRGKDMDYYPQEYSSMNPISDRERSRFYEGIHPDTSNRSFSRLSEEYARRSPDRFARRSPDIPARRSPDRFARRSPDIPARRSPDRFARRSPDIPARRSPDRYARLSPDRLARYSPERLGRRSPERMERRSPDRYERSSRRSPDRFARHSRSRSPRRYSRSPEQSYSHAAEKLRSSYARSPPKHSEPYRSDDVYRSSSSFEKAYENIEGPPISSSEMNRKVIAEALINMPSATFLKMALIKLKGMEITGMHDLNLLVDLLQEAKAVLSTHIRKNTTFKEKILKTLENNQLSPSVQSEPPQLARNLPSQAQPISFQNGMQLQDSFAKSAISQINDLIFGARKESDLNLRSSLQTQPTNYSKSASSTGPNAFSSGGPVATNYPPPAVPNFPPGPSASNFLPPPPPVPNFPPAFGTPNYQRGPASAYHGNQSSSSGIPGLTLTEEESSQQQLGNNYASPQPWSENYRRDQDFPSYKRF